MVQITYRSYVASISYNRPYSATARIERRSSTARSSMVSAPCSIYGTTLVSNHIICENGTPERGKFIVTTLLSRVKLAALYKGRGPDPRSMWPRSSNTNSDYVAPTLSTAFRHIGTATVGGKMLLCLTTTPPEDEGEQAPRLDTDQFFRDLRHRDENHAPASVANRSCRAHSMKKKNKLSSDMHVCRCRLRGRPARPTFGTR